MDPPRCATCDRTFASGAARARHELRCKARPRTRRKACQHCSRSKVKCDNQTPACRRCVVMKLSCTYPQGSAAAPDSEPAPVSDAWLPTQDCGSVGQRGDGWDVPASYFGLGTHCLTDASEDSSLQVYAATAASTSTATPSSTATSSYLADQWTTAEHGLDYVDGQCKAWADDLRDSRPPFIHARDWDSARRHPYLHSVVSIARVYTLGTPESLVEEIDSLLQQVQVHLAKHDRTDDLATLQAVLLNSIMRVYRASNIAAEAMDRLSVRTCQHILSKYSDNLCAHAQRAPEDWDDWLFNESLYRSFFALHTVDYVTNARQGNQTALCPLFPEAPLPSPDHVWDAPGPEEWASRRKRWEERCGGEALRGKHILSWLGGKETGREIALEGWFREVGAFGAILFVCGRAQSGTPGVERML